MGTNNPHFYFNKILSPLQRGMSRSDRGIWVEVYFKNPPSPHKFGATSFSRRKEIFYPSTLFKSAIKSSISSIPTLNLTRLSTTPTRSLSSLGIEAWVMVAG